jgi:hypothetical protein
MDSVIESPCEHLNCRWWLSGFEEILEPEATGSGMRQRGRTSRFGHDVVRSTGKVTDMSNVVVVVKKVAATISTVGTYVHAK